MTCPDPRTGEYASWCPPHPTTTTTTAPPVTTTSTLPATTTTTVAPTTTTTLAVTTTTVPVYAPIIPREPNGDDCTLHSTGCAPQLPVTGPNDVFLMSAIVLGVVMIAVGLIFLFREKVL